METAVPSKKKVVLLVGSTGNGKSTLGSFLLDPVKYERSPKFKRARSMAPETQSVSVEDLDERGYKFSFIDTPGLNESAEADLKHMIELLQIVQKQGSVAAVIVCYKLDGKIDTQFQRSVQFYAELFRTCLDRNFFVVLMNVTTDQKSIALRKRDGIDIAKNVEFVATEVRRIAGLAYLPCVLTIDANPLFVAEDVDYLASCANRKLILDTILDMPLVSVTEIRFRKTPEMDIEDNQLIERYRGQITGYEDALVWHNNITTNLLAKITKILIPLDKERSALGQLRENHGEKSSFHEQQSGLWNCSRDWTFTWHEVPYSITTQYPISRVGKSAPTNFEWKNCVETLGGIIVSGSLTGNWFQGVQAAITVYSYKKDIYKDEIPGLSKEIQDHEKEMNKLEVELGILQAGCVSEKKEIDQLLSFINDRNVNIQQLSKPRISLDTALQRLEEYSLLLKGGGK